MRIIRNSLWILLLSATTLVLGRCGRLSNDSKDDPAPEDILYIPDAWDGEADWSGNALKVEDIAP